MSQAWFIGRISAVLKFNSVKCGRNATVNSDVALLQGSRKSVIPACPSNKQLLDLAFPGQILIYFSCIFSWLMICLSVCPLGNWEWGVTCQVGKPFCPRQLDGSFSEPCCWELIFLTVHGRSDCRVRRSAENPLDVVCSIWPTKVFNFAKNYLLMDRDGERWQCTSLAL